MKLTTLNLQGFTDWERRKPVIIEYLRSVNPDLVLFQEVVFIPTISPYNQAQILNQDLDYAYENSAVTRLQASSDYEIYREGLAVLSRYSIAKIDTLVLKKAPEDEHNRIIQLIDFTYNDHVIKLAHIHVSLSDPGPDFATAHIQEVFTLLESRKEQRIVAGDFNTSSPKEAAVRWKDDYISSADISSYISQTNAISEAGRLVDRCNDQVWIPKACQFVGGVTVSTDELSDHRAVTVDIEPGIFK